MSESEFYVIHTERADLIHAIQDLELVKYKNPALYEGALFIVENMRKRLLSNGHTDLPEIPK